MPHGTETTQKFALIGAGPMGLAAAKTLAEQSVDLLRSHFHYLGKRDPADDSLSKEHISKSPELVMRPGRKVISIA